MNISAIKWKNVSLASRNELLRRPVSERRRELSLQVREIIDSVQKEGDAAVIRMTKQYDRVTLDSLKVSSTEFESACLQVKPEVQNALKEAIRRVTLFHAAQFPKSIDLETSPGVRCERRFLPIQQVGLYIPGGTAPLPSTVVMLGVPSMIAKCPRRVLMTPPRADGTVDPTILLAAQLLGIREVYKVGGAQAIAALAYGTESIKKVDKIYGPGNSWVTEAKLQVSQDPFGAACDLPAGPSEVMVLADESANPVFVASDLLSQAEHGIDSQVVLVCNSEKQIQKILAEVRVQLEALPRNTIASEALSKSLFIEVSDLGEAFQICNDYAPEHLILQIENPRNYVGAIDHAGSVFLGAWTPESAGDYASGTNHVLPTYGFARAYGGLTTESFMKSMTIQEISPSGLRELGPVVEILAETEMLMAHRNAVRVRLDQLNSSENAGSREGR